MANRIALNGHVSLRVKRPFLFFYDYSSSSSPLRGYCNPPSWICNALKSSFNLTSQLPLFLLLYKALIWCLIQTLIHNLHWRRYSDRHEIYRKVSSPQPQASRRCIFSDVSQEPAEIDLLFRLIHFWEARNIAKGMTFIGTLQKAGPLLGWSSSNTTNRYECLYPTFFHRSSLSFGFDTKWD